MHLRPKKSLGSYASQGVRDTMFTKYGKNNGGESREESLVLLKEETLTVRASIRLVSIDPDEYRKVIP